MDPEIAAEFFAEGNEHLDALESCLLRLEAQADDKEAIDRAFRAAHSIKGAAGFLLLGTVEQLMHAAEDLLDLLRSGKAPLDARMMGALLRAGDRCRVLLDAARDGGDANGMSVAEIVAELRSAAEHALATPTDALRTEPGSPAAVAVPTAAPPDAGNGRPTPMPTSNPTAPPAPARAAVPEPGGPPVLVGRAVRVVQRPEPAVAEPLMPAPALSAPPAARPAPASGSPFALAVGDGEPASPGGFSLAPPVPGNPFALPPLPAPAAPRSPPAPAGRSDAPAAVAAAPEVGARSPAPAPRPPAAPDASRSAPAPAPAPQAGPRGAPPLATTTEAAGPEGPAVPASGRVASPRPAPATPAATPPRGDPEDNGGTIRVDVSLLDDIMNLVGELVVARNRLVQIVGEREDRALTVASRRVDHLTSDLQRRVMKTRMRPVSVAWGALARLVRDVATATGKLVNVEMHGQHTELDRSLLEVLKDPLAHMIRNCVGHGIETPDVRVVTGKPPTGTITLRSRHSGGQVQIEVSDDGRGIQVEKVRARAITNGLITAEQAQSMDEDALMALIFRPGFSTAETVSNLQGRGVGMDVVKSSVERVGGTVDIRSVPGQGTTFRLKLPLTLAIVPALITTVADRRFCISQANLVEIVDLMTAEAQSRVERLAGAPLYRLRGQLLPLVPLGTTLGLPGFGDELKGYIVVVEVDVLRFGIVVDEIQHTEEIVVKPLGAAVKRAQVYSGATVLGDGSVALVLDVVALARRGRVEAHAAEALERERTRAAADAGERRSLLRLDVTDVGLVAVDVESVLRIDEARSVDVFKHAGELVFRYQDRVVPLRLLSSGTWQQIVVCEHGPHLVGIAVAEVLDVVTQQVKVTAGLGAAWSEGLSFVDGQPTALLDLSRIRIGGGGQG